MSDPGIVVLGEQHLDGVVALRERDTGRPADVDTIRGWLAASPCVGALVGDEVVGFVLTTRFAPDVVELTTTIVDAAHRRQGLGTRLLTAMHDAARAAGAAMVVCVVSELYEGHDPATARPEYYLRRGYREIARTPSTVVLATSLTDGPAG